MISFTHKLTDHKIKGKLSYSHREGLALSFTSVDPDIESLKKNEFVFAHSISLWFETENGRLLYVDGYTPIQSWSKGVVALPQAQNGEVYAHFAVSDAPHAGIAIPLDFDQESLLYDSNTGWCFIGGVNTDTKIEIATGIVVGLEDDAIVSIWLNPEFKD